VESENKKHRLLTETELLSLWESSEPEIVDAEKRLSATAALVLDGAYEPGTLSRLVKEKLLNSATVRDAEGQAMFILVYGFNYAGWLTIEGTASCNPKSRLELVFEAVDALAAHYKAKSIQFVTRWKALFRAGDSHGFKPVGVLMFKNALPA